MPRGSHSDRAAAEHRRVGQVRWCGEPGEVAAAVLWRLSPAASYVTGAELEVSGGL
jgi:NAD(P)-dependent dehydrogenase (short-subunit alcohol dehydrogenase family)